MGYLLLAKEVRSEKWELRSKKLKVKREKEKEIYCKMKNEKCKLQNYNRNIPIRLEASSQKLFFGFGIFNPVNPVKIDRNIPIKRKADSGRRLASLRFTNYED